MRTAPWLITALVAPLLLAGCAAPPTQQVSAQCQDFARSGGYPFLRGGSTYRSNQSIEQLPDAPPLIFGARESETERHLDEEQYLGGWCMTHM